MSSFRINPAIIPWALRRLQMSREEFARALGTSAAVVEAWEKGTKQPTVRQAQTLADKLFLPLGRLVLRELPQIALNAVDFRTVGNRRVAAPSLELWATYNQALTRQEWYRECALENEYAPCACVGTITLNTPVHEAAARLRKVLGEAENAWETGHRSWERRFAALVDSIEEKAGVMVMRNGVVGNNTSRPLDVEEFRGFAIPDEYAPLIFINGQDSRNAQLFTLVHELVHIFLGRGGISGQDYLKNSENATERYCNQVAAEYLVPEKSLRQSWRDAAGQQPQSETVAGKVERLASRYQVSNLVMLLRCRSLELLDSQTARELWRQETEAIRRKRQLLGGGGNPYRNLANRIGRLFARSIIWQAESMEIQLADAFRLLGVKNYQAMQRLSEEVGVLS